MGVRVADFGAVPRCFRSHTPHQPAMSAPRTISHSITVPVKGVTREQLWKGLVHKVRANIRCSSEIWSLSRAQLAPLWHGTCYRNVELMLGVMTLAALAVFRCANGHDCVQIREPQLFIPVTDVVVVKDTPTYVIREATAPLGGPGGMRMKERITWDEKAGTVTFTAEDDPLKDGQVVNRIDTLPDGSMTLTFTFNFQFKPSAPQQAFEGMEKGLKTMVSKAAGWIANFSETCTYKFLLLLFDTVFQGTKAVQDTVAATQRLYGSRSSASSTRITKPQLTTVALVAGLAILAISVIKNFRTRRA